MLFCQTRISCYCQKKPEQEDFPGCPWPVDDVRHGIALPYSSASAAITRGKPCHLLVSSASLDHLRNGWEKFYWAAQKFSEIIPFSSSIFKQPYLVGSVHSSFSQHSKFPTKFFWRFWSNRKLHGHHSCGQVLPSAWENSRPQGKPAQMDITRHHRRTPPSAHPGPLPTNLPSAILFRLQLIKHSTAQILTCSKISQHTSATLPPLPSAFN